MNSVSTVTFPAESTRDIAGLVDQHCKATENSTEALDAPHSGSDSYFFIKSKREEDKDIFLCSAPRITSHQAMDYLQNMFDFSCGNGNFRQCTVPADYDIKVFSETISAVFVRHPFDRLILEFKHKIHRELSAEDGKNVQSSSNIKSRKILAYSRFKKWKKKQKKGSHKFRQFIKSNVLSSNSTILPISQICRVCFRSYDVFLKLDDGLSPISELYSLARTSQSSLPSDKPDPKHKIFGQKLQRKYFSEITADEMELLVNKFYSDFLLFGYSFEAYKKALKKH